MEIKCPRCESEEYDDRKDGTYFCYGCGMPFSIENVKFRERLERDIGGKIK